MNIKKMKYDYDLKDELIKKTQESKNFAGYTKMAEFLRVYQILDDEKKKNLLKFIIYKLSAYLDNSEVKYYDCDVSMKSTFVFQKAYKWLKDYQMVVQKSYTQKFELVKDEVCFRGDTMTSALTPLVRYFELKGIDKQVYKDSFEDYILDNIDKVSISKNVSDFLCNVHTIGNFIPVPKGFNVGRSNFGKWDSWDLTLQQIYLWYQDNKNTKEETNNETLNVLFTNSKNKDECVLYCIEWLKMFSSWEEFVNQNYLNAFLDVKGKPIMFFKGHSLKNPLPQTLEESEDFFSNVNNCILKRGIEINKIMGIEVSKIRVSSKFDRIKNRIGRLFVAECYDETIDDLKEYPLKNLDIILFGLSKWVPIIYSIILFILYVIVGNNENGIFSYGKKPVDLFDNRFFIFAMFLCVMSAFVISYNKNLKETTWKTKKILKIASYIGGYGICISLIIVEIYKSNFVTEILNDIWRVMGYNQAIIIYNALLLLFFIALVVELFCVTVMVISSFLIPKAKAILFMAFFRIIELFILMLTLLLLSIFIDYWKFILVLVIVVIIVLIVINRNSEGNEEFLKVVDEDNNEIMKIRKDNFFDKL